MSVCLKCDDLRRLPVPGPRQGRRRGNWACCLRCSSPQRNPGDERKVSGSTPTRRAEVTEVVVDRHGQPRASRATSSCCGRRRQHRQDLAAVGKRQAPKRPGQRLRSGRPKLHVPQQPGRAGPLQETQPTVFQKTLSINDFYFGARLPLSIGQHPDARQVKGAHVPGRAPVRSGLATMVTLDRRRARRRFLAHDRRPPRPEEPRHGRRRWQHPAQLHAQQPGTHSTAPGQAQGDARPPRLPPSPHPHNLYLSNRSRSRVWPPGRYLPLRHGPKTSVLDVNCKAHELDNLYVVDTSFFPSIGAVNPSLRQSRTRCGWAIT